jgi:hypothetical protein
LGKFTSAAKSKLSLHFIFSFTDEAGVEQNEVAESRPDLAEEVGVEQNPVAESRSDLAEEAGVEQNPDEANAVYPSLG